MSRKEEILRRTYEHYKTVVIPDENWADWETCEKDGTARLVYDAMDEYAKEIAIGFHKWFTYESLVNFNDEGLLYDPVSEKVISEDELFNLYIKSLDEKAISRK